jgi:hypothetical protein
MPETETDILLKYPPRLLTAAERGVVAEWLSLAQDISSAYVSSRPSDDPALYLRVVISDAIDNRPTHLIHAPAGRRLWAKLSLGQDTRTELFESLQAALNSIRPVLIGASTGYRGYPGPGGGAP